jgi:hypothetical protein
MDEQDLEWHWIHGDDAIEAAEAVTESNSYVKVAYSHEDLQCVFERIRGLEGTDAIEEYDECTVLIKINMGNLRLCQLDRGELIRELGGIGCLLTTLVEVKRWMQYGERNEIQTAAWNLVLVCWRALRDLACGSIGNRTAIRHYKHEHTSGLDLMIYYLKLFDDLMWEDMDDLQVDLVTAVIGAMRNASHATYENCKDLHDNGATALLVGRLLQGTSPIGLSLPEQCQPWREGCFRAAGTLLNIAEEYDPCLQSCSTNPSVISILIASWGSNRRLRHVFSLMLACAAENLTQDEYDAAWNDHLT